MELSTIKKLESAVIGCTLNIHWWGIRRQVTTEVITSVANNFGANPKYLTVSKKLFNSKNLYYTSLVETRNSIGTYWKDITLPYIENGTRLLKKDLLLSFEEKMAVYKEELGARLIDFSNNYPSLKEEASIILGNLYNSQDYPLDISSLFSFNWSYPTLTPPEFLLEINPQLYLKQQELVRGRFEEAIKKAETAFGNELQTLVTNLAERMKPEDDGTIKRFKDATVQTNFKDFFKKFKNISVTNSSDLEDIVQQAEKIIQGVQPETLRTSSEARNELQEQMQNISNLLEDKLKIVPKRNLITTPSLDNIVIPVNTLAGNF